MFPTEQSTGESPQSALGRTLRLLVALVSITVMVVMFLHGINLI
jgi:hypothetical protein